MILKKIIQSQRTLPVDLGKDTKLKEILNFQSQNEVVDLILEYQTQEIYVAETIDDQHICLAYNASARTILFTGKHFLKYFPEDKKVVIKSQHRSSFLWYLVMFVLMLSLLFSGNTTVKSFLIICAFAAGFTIFEIIGSTIAIRSEAKEIERELIIRINYVRNNKKR